MTKQFEAILEEALKALRRELGENLYSCCLYGSMVRGNVVEGVSDLNLLVILKESNPQAHEGLARAIGGNPYIAPFILARRGLERSVKAFSPKFASIMRNYRVLHGADPLKDVLLDTATQKFLCEQAIRNLRLRLAHNYVTRLRYGNYDRQLGQMITPLFVHFAEALRLEGRTVPNKFADRIMLFVSEYGMSAADLKGLLELKQTVALRFDEAQIVEWHKRVFTMIDQVLIWIETKWSS